jgi:uncharacterized membrane protein YgdD (TMEM256/DUF423 family)
MKGSTWIACGAVLGGLGVILGAFGAHGLTEYLSAQRQTANYETAVRYQMYHALALVFTGLIADRYPSKLLNVAGWCFLLGIVFFSGALYGIALAGISQLGMIAPIGGTLLIAAWAMLAFASLVRRD